MWEKFDLNKLSRYTKGVFRFYLYLFISKLVTRNHLNIIVQGIGVWFLLCVTLLFPKYLPLIFVYGRTLLSEQI